MYVLFFYCHLKGLTELKRVLLSAALDPAVFPHLSRLPTPSSLLLYDDILALRHEKKIAVPWIEFRSLAERKHVTNPEVLEAETAFLVAVVCCFS